MRTFCCRCYSMFPCLCGTVYSKCYRICFINLYCCRTEVCLCNSSVQFVVEVIAVILCIVCASVFKCRCTCTCRCIQSCSSKTCYRKGCINCYEVVSAVCCSLVSGFIHCFKYYVVLLSVLKSRKSPCECLCQCT